MASQCFHLRLASAVLIAAGLSMAGTADAQGLLPAPWSNQNPTPQIEPPVEAGQAQSVPAAALADSSASSGQTSAPEIRNAQGDSTEAPAGDSSMSHRAETLFPEPRDEFREMVEDSAGRALPVFGESFFAPGPEAFAALERAPALEDYVVGIGDELNIKAWGSIDVDYKAVVDARGEIFIPRVGNIPVAGVRYSELEARVRSGMDKAFRKYQLSVTLGAMRTVPVLVVGNVRSPGTYAVNAVSTVLNALAAAGGPAVNGSMRAIEIKRDGRVIGTFDLYSLLLSGDRSSDLRLVAGDVIHVCPVGPRLAITGSVSTPGIYEIRPGETVASALVMAGGLSVIAKDQQITVERVVDHKFRIALEVRTEGFATTAVSDGDLLIVSRITGEIRDSVTLRGAVTEPIRRQWFSGMRVRDLIRENDSLIVPEYWNEKNSSLRQSHPADDNAERYKTTLKRSFDEINWDYAVVERLDRDTLRTRLLPFNLGQAMQGDPTQNLELVAGDAVTVFSKRDILVPAENQTRIVCVEGEVNSPGFYLASASDTLQDVIAKAGGLTSRAYLYGAEFTRESVRRAQEEQMRQAAERWGREVDTAAERQTRNAIGSDDVVETRVKQESDRALLLRLTSVHASGRIALSLKEDAVSLAELPGMTLEDGDRIFIPTRPQTVTVVGDVFNADAFSYEKGRDAVYYVNEAGGLKRGNSWRNVFVIKANGQVEQVKRGASFPAGSGVVVMPEIYKDTLLHELRDWTTILYQFGLGAAAINVIK